MKRWNGSFRIENQNRPGHFWNARKFGFTSLLDGGYSTYRRKGTALRIAEKLSKIYQVAVEKDTHETYTFNTLPPGEKRE